MLNLYILNDSYNMNIAVIQKDVNSFLDVVMGILIKKTGR
ncbi:MAG: hypothetical protein RHS_3992 [Robinsoniella sp. RHS]|nr:MAG: hypothetical protein RHS_4291 [Robinsoniella sp. RHS]KLU70215.1 MAG: hypothetical protein RHS_3992 [Robinsoniella sp. RHS]